MRIKVYNEPEQNIEMGFNLDAHVARVNKHLTDKENPHGVTAEQTGAIPEGQKGAAGGVATLGEDGKIPTEQLPKSSKVPTKTSELDNDSGFITKNDIPKIPSKTSELTNDSGFITSDDIPEPPTVPTKTSELTNDSGFITKDDIPTELPKVTPDDVGKFLRVDSDGKWTAETIPSILGVSF